MEMDAGGKPKMCSATRTETGDQTPVAAVHLPEVTRRLDHDTPVRAAVRTVPTPTVNRASERSTMMEFSSTMETLMEAQRTQIDQQRKQQERTVH